MFNIKKNMQIAVEEMEKLKSRDSALRFRIETCVNKESVKLYVIKKHHIQEVVTINGSITEREGK